MKFTLFLCARLCISLTMLMGLISCGGQHEQGSLKEFAAAIPSAPAEIGKEFPGKRNDYTITKTPDGFTITSRIDGASVVNLSGAPALRFSDVIVNLQIAEKSKKIAEADLNLLIELYIAFFNRLPDADGLAYWIDRVSAGMTIEQIANSFFDAAILYSDLTGYTSTMSHTDFVKVIYKNVLGRSGVYAPPDVDVGYWANELGSGRTSRGGLVRNMLNSAHSFEGDTTWGWVADLLNNKLNVGRYFSVAQGLNYLTPEKSISRTSEIAKSITSTDIASARNLIEMNDVGFDLLRFWSPDAVLSLKAIEYSKGLIQGRPFPGIRYMAYGPDGNMWFTEWEGNRIGRITPDGIITEFSIGLSPGANPRRITAGPDGNMWFTEEGVRKIGRISMNGTITEFSKGISEDAGLLFDITSGADGNLWFTESRGRIGRISTDGVVTEFPTGSETYLLSGITSGPDGNIWFTSQSGNGKIGRITPTGVVTEFPISAKERVTPIYIVTGSDGNLWFTEYGVGRIGRITTNGVITEFKPQSGGAFWDIANSPDGALIVKMRDSIVLKISTSGVFSNHRYVGSSMTFDKWGNLWSVEEAAVLRLSANGELRRFSNGISIDGVVPSNPYAIASGKNGDFWFSDGSNGRIGRLNLQGNISEFEIGNQREELKPISYLNSDNIWFSSIYRVGNLSENGQKYFVNDSLATDYVSCQNSTRSNANYLWIGVKNDHTMGRLSLDRSFSVTSLGVPSGFYIVDCVINHDGSVWFSETKASIDLANGKIIRVGQDGVVKEFVGFSQGIQPEFLTLGSDGSVWFIGRSQLKWVQGTNGNSNYFTSPSVIGKISATGEVVEFGKDRFDMAYIEGITLNIDGNIWFTERERKRIGKISANGLITEYEIQGLNGRGKPVSIAANGLGKVCFTFREEQDNTGKIACFMTPL